MSQSSPLLTPPAEERFICEDCDYKCLAFNDVHTRKHTLVRVIEKVVEAALPTPTEERLGIVEGHLESVQTRLMRMETRFEGIEARFGGMEAQLERVEALLSKRPMEKDALDSPAEVITNLDI